jgi:HemY protein
MRGVIWLLLLAVVAVVAASLLGPNDGLVSVYWGGWRTDLSLNLAVLLLVGLGAALLLGVQAINSLVSLPRRAGQWRALRRERAAEAALREAQAEYFAGRYGRAQKAAQRALVLQTDAEALAGDARFRLLARLLAAGSLHRLQDRRRRDAMVERALAERPGTAATGGVAGDDATRLLAAEWALDDRDAGRALEMLDALPPGAARRTQALRLRLQAARLARQPVEALRTARLLANHQAFSPLVAQTLLRSLAGEVLETAHDLQQLRRLWNQLDAGDRRDAQVAARGAAPADRWRYLDGAGLIGVIPTVTKPFCGDCDRVRLTADGQFRTCLFATDEFDMRRLLRDGADDDAIASAIRRAVGTKWAGHQINQVTFVRPRRSMSQIGG